MPDILTPDLCVIGAGAGGLAVATGAAALGAKVVLLEKRRMGGQRLHSACIPTKALLVAAKAAHGVHHAAEFGIGAVELDVNYSKVRDHIARVMARRAPYDTPKRLRGLGVEVIESSGHFINSDTFGAESCLIKARVFVLATGSSPVIPALPGLEMIRYLTTDTWLNDKILPKQLLILGAEPRALEIGQAYQRLGSNVTLIDGGQALAGIDPELTRPALAACRREGVVILEASFITQLVPRGPGLRAFIDGPEGKAVMDASHLLLAVGRHPNVHSLGLEAAGVPIVGGRISVDARLRTANKAIYAVGDVAGEGCFSHLAEHQADIVLRNALLGQRVRPKMSQMPRVVYSDPEIAEIGLSEAQAQATGHKVAVYRWPLAESDRARIDHKESGLIKIITRRNGTILGVGIVGEAAGEMLAPWSLALQNGLKLSDLALVQLPFPSQSAILRRAAMQAPGTGPQPSGIARLMTLFRWRR